MRDFVSTQSQAQGAFLPVSIPLPHAKLQTLPLCLFFLSSGSINLLITESIVNKDHLHGGERCRRREAVNSPCVGNNGNSDAEEKGEG